MTVMAFSGRQMSVLKFVVLYIQRRGIAPTIREIGKATGISSTSCVAYHLGKLDEKGAIRRYPDVARGIVLLDAGKDAAGVSSETPET